MESIAKELGIAPPAARLRPAICLWAAAGFLRSLSVSLAYALGLLAKRSVGREDLARCAFQAETSAGVTCGTQDQLASIYGGVGLVERHRGIGTRKTYPRGHGDAGLPVQPRPPWRGSAFWIIHRACVRRCPAHASSGRCTSNDLVGSATAEALRQSEPSEVMNCMQESAKLLHALHPAILDTSFLNLLRRLGARAAKPCGAGGPGAVWAVLTDPSDRQAFRAQALKSGLRMIDANLTSEGVRQLGDSSSDSRLGLGSRQPIRHVR